MKCISPVRIRRGGQLHDFACQRCNFCLMTRRAEWTMRIFQESKLHVDSDFLTMTYDDDHLPIDGSLKKEHLQLFMKRLRKGIYPLKCRYYNVGEYGTESGRAHYHSILFGVPKFVDL